MSSYYHVCACCNSKWFQPEAIACCPRCGRQSQSREQLTPPWQSYGDSVALYPSTTGDANTAGESASAHDLTATDEVRQKEFLQAFREQLRRMFCPGCGEREPEF
ncbi:MAG TPA: hypothetical protein VGJ04_09865 [Pirellulales bacterium]|jgi:hypothetical protein